LKPRKDLKKPLLGLHVVGMSLSLIASSLGGAATLLLLYLYRINSLLHSVPPEAQAASPHRWTEEEIRETYERVRSKPIDYAPHLPPKRERRYVVVGGSGML